MAIESVSRLLDENADLKPVATRLAYIKRLQRRYRSLAPGELAEASRVCAIDGTTVVICATSGPVAAALRHHAPRLLEGLRELARKSSKHSRDQELTGSRIELQVDIPKVRPRTIARNPMPTEQLARIAAKLSDSPLKETLERISEPDQSKRTRSKT
ncbi:MAG: DciA family protein [Usitatibacter sp.]